MLWGKKFQEALGFYKFTINFWRFLKKMKPQMNAEFNFIYTIIASVARFMKVK